MTRKIGRPSRFLGRYNKLGADNLSRCSDKARIDWSLKLCTVGNASCESLEEDRAELLS